MACPELASILLGITNNNKKAAPPEYVFYLADKGL